MKALALYILVSLLLLLLLQQMRARGLWDGVGVRYLPASRWLRLLLSRRMGAASIFQTRLIWESFKLNIYRGEGWGAMFSAVLPL